MGSQTLRLTSSGDLLITPDGNADMSSDAAKTAQDLWVLLRTIKGSYAFNVNFGIDYSKIMGKGVSDSLIKATISEEIVKHPSVSSIREFRVIRNTGSSSRSIYLIIKAVLTSGEVISISGGI